MGLRLDLPAKESADWTVLYGPYDQSIDRGEFAPVDGSYLCFMPMEYDVTLFSVQYYTEAQWDKWLSGGHTIAELTGAADAEEIGRQGGMVYVYACPTPNDSGMDDVMKATYNRVLGMLPHIRNSITLTVRGAANTGTFPAFSTTDLDGNPIDSTSFSDYTMTMLNIWGTFCGPCIEEMPSLSTLSQNMPEGTRMLGLVTDALDTAHIELAKKITSETGATYPNLIPDAALQEYINTYVAGVPMTIFINADGEIVGDAILGKQGADAYWNALLSRREGIPNGKGDGASGTPPEQAIPPAEQGSTAGQAVAASEESPARTTRMEQLRSFIDLSGTVAFSAQTPFGEAIDSSVFTGYDLTMINIWGTLCQPCIKEMPDIQRLYEDFEKQGVNIIGFIANYQEDRVEKAAEILTAQGVTYANVVFDDETSGAISAQVPGYPTTVFVNGNGQIVGEQLPGAHGYAEYASAIRERLGDVGK
ncbi:MAG: TlpA disulfide reductase family protein [Gemmiger sp.]|nr:TlpA disulfide reductase family protein [Gemmiger sp.]